MTRVNSPWTKAIAEFHERFDLAYDGPPRFLDESTFAFRRRFKLEELHETLTAHQEGDLEGVLDGIVDLIYVALGDAYLMGLDVDEAFARVHRANMRKVRATDALQSRRGSVSDVVKPPGWVPPSLLDLVRPEVCSAEGCEHGVRGPVYRDCVRINCPGRTTP